jgi:hypothetical protein
MTIFLFAWVAAYLLKAAGLESINYYYRLIEGLFEKHRFTLIFRSCYDE